MLHTTNYYQQNIEVGFYIPTAALVVQVSYSEKDIETRRRGKGNNGHSCMEMAVETIIKERHRAAEYPPARCLSIILYTYIATPRTPSYKVPE